MNTAVLRTLIAVGTLLALAAAPTFSFAAPHPATLQDLVSGYPGSTMSLSPDDTMLAAEDDSHLALLSYPNGKVIQDLGDGFLPKWSPSGDALAFYSLRSGTMQVWVWNRGGQLHAATNFPRGVDPDFYTRFVGYITDALPYSWSPDGKSILLASRVPVSRGGLSPNDPLVVTNTTDPNLTTAGVCGLPTFCPTDVHIEGRQLVDRPISRENLLINQIFVADVASGTVTQLTSPEHMYYDPIWSKDGSSVITASIASNGKVGDVWAAYQNSAAKPDDQIVRIDPRSKAVTVIADNAGAARQFLLTNDGDAMYFLTSAGPLDPAHLAMLTFASGKVQPAAFTTNIDFIRPTQTAALEVQYRDNEKDIFAYISGNSATASGSHAISGATVDSFVNDSRGGVSWIDALGNVQYLASGAADPQQIYAFRPLDIERGKDGTITFKTKHGDTLTGSILYPLNYVPGKRYPLIVDAYPLSHGDGWMHSMGGNQTWAAAGYVTFMPGARGPHVWMNASNKAFGDAGKGPKGWDVALDDVNSGVDALIAKGIVDPNRMCLYGHSNGGGEVSYLVTMTHRFKCAVVAAPAMANWVTAAVLPTGGRDMVDQFSGGFNFNKNPMDFVKMSSVFYLYKSTTPMLIVDGDNDAGFLLDSIAVYNAARDAGVPVTFVRYPGQGHVFTGAAMQDFWNRQMAFFAKYLGGTPPPVPQK